MFVGILSLQVLDKNRDINFPVQVLYPTKTPSSLVEFGPFKLDVSPGSQISDGHFPVAVVSHGSGSSPMVYRTIAWHLAKNGYVVVMPEHHGNNRNNNSLENTVENLQLRPRHVRLAMDAVFSDVRFKGSVRTEQFAVIGHSMGGYTALALAGGQPWSGLNQRVEVEGDERVGAVVLMAAASGWFTPLDSLSKVTSPIFMYTAEKDKITPRWQAQLVLDYVPNKDNVTLKVVENSGHFSFLSPFPPEMVSPRFPPSVDPEGFDRVAFDARRNDEILTFLNAHLGSD